MVHEPPVMQGVIHLELGASQPPVASQRSFIVGMMTMHQNRVLVSTIDK